MTNVEESSTVENFSGVETNSRDDIQLTELLPVKKLSVICNGTDRDDCMDDDVVADAFKALREGNKHFSINGDEFCDDGNEKTLDNKHGELIVMEIETSINSNVLEKFNDLQTRMNKNFDKVGDIDCSKKKGNRVFKKRIKYLKNRQQTVTQTKENQTHQISAFSLDSDSHDIILSSSSSRLLNLETNNKRIITETSKFDATRGRNLSKIKSNGHHNMNGDGSKSKDKPKRVSDSEGTEDDHSLREKIDAIIQANYVLERKNNNTMRENRNSLKNDSVNNSDGSEMDVRNSEEDSSSSQKKHRCAICKARFKGSGGLRTHYKVVHAAGPMFTCNECGKEFPLKERLKLHVRTHTGYKPYKCTECDKSFARGGQLVQHRRTHTQVKPYRCVICPGTFSCAANLALHVKRHNGQKDHKCEICGRAFVRRDALKKHLECLHKDVKSFLCVICNKTFKGHLPQHMRTHAQDRPHGCAICGQRFAQKSQLTVHQRTHSGQRPFRCLVCWQAFAHSTALKLHTRRHTGERPFKCAECNAGFTQLPHWKKHMRCVHGRTDPYCCKNCNTFFRIKSDLETHEKTCMVMDSQLENVDVDNRVVSGRPIVPKYRIMTVEKMRLLLAVLFKRISKPERLDELGFGKRLIDQVLKDSLLSAGKDPAESNDCSEFEVLKKNLATFLEWTVPREHWEAFKKLNKTPEEILETLTVSQ